MPIKELYSLKVYLNMVSLVGSILVTPQNVIEHLQNFKKSCHFSFNFFSFSSKLSVPVFVSTGSEMSGEIYNLKVIPINVHISKS